MHLLSFSLLLYVEIIVVYYWFLAMLSHCFPGLCGITVCLTHTDGLTSEVYNPPTGRMLTALSEKSNSVAQ